MSAVVHYDEAAPHCHVLLLPLVRGRMIGSDLIGGRAKLQAMQANFHEQVGQRYGLTRQTAQKPLGAALRQQAVDCAFAVLMANSGLADAVLRVLVGAHLTDPAPLMRVLGLGMPPPKMKGSFAATMTRPCKPEKPVRFEKRNHIGFDDSAAAEHEQTLSCVGFADSASSFSPPIEPQTSARTSTVITQQAEPAATINIGASQAKRAGEADKDSHLADVTATEASARATSIEDQAAALGNSRAGNAAKLMASSTFIAGEFPTIGDNTTAPDASKGIYADTDTSPNVHTVERDADYPAASWDPDKGEFVAVPMRVSSGRLRAAMLVRSVIDGGEGALASDGLLRWGA